MNKKDFYSNLLNNAFDFLNESINNFSIKDKYSLINFYTAIELILKARLMYEHWSLIIAKNCELNYDKLMIGDFQSVDSKESINRLRNAVKVNVSADLEQSINILRQHRNKMVHFFHESQNKRTSTTIAKDQLRCWYFLNQFITKECKDSFGKWCKKASEIDKKFKKQRAYLSIIYEKIKSKIENNIKKGFHYKKCPSCRYKSLSVGIDQNIPNVNHCLVCDYSEIEVIVKCPQCNSKLSFIDEGFAKCKKCHSEIEPEYLAKLLDVNNYDPYDGYETRGNCVDCDTTHTVVLLSNRKYFCTSCFEVFDEMFQCNWCNELQTKESECSSISGCYFCDGSNNYE